MQGFPFAQFTAFAAVAENRSFSRAAIQLGVSGTWVSAAIRSLEERLGVRLLNRTTRSVALTEVGEQLLTDLQPVFEGVEKAIDAVNAFRESPAGTLRLAVHPVAAVTVLGPLVAQFSAAYPAIRLEIAVHGERRDIVREGFDAGIHFGDGLAQDMIAIPVGEEVGLSTVASPEYLARSGPLSTPEDLRLHNCIRYRWGAESGSESWKFASRDQRIDIPVQGSLTVNDLNLGLQAALDGIGVARSPECWVSQFVDEGRLVRVLADCAPVGPGCRLFYSSRRHIPLKLRVLIDFLRREARLSAPNGYGTARHAQARQPRLSPAKERESVLASPSIRH